MQRLMAGALFAAGVMALAPCLSAQMVSAVQQDQFRSQWVGEQVDQLSYGGIFSPSSSLGAVVGSLQTPDEVQREVDASLASVKAPPPFVFKPSLGLGWQISNQGSQSTNSQGVATFNTDSSAFIAPSAACLYDRDHGPWHLSAGYSIGYRYFSNPNYTANGTGSLRNPLTQTAFLRTALEMSRYIFNAMLNGSSGTGYDISSGSNNRQTAATANTDMKYILSSVSTVALKAGYNIQNSSGSSNTPNNNVTTLFADLEPVYHLSDKTHVGALFGAGQSYQSLDSSQSIPVVDGNVNVGTVTINSTPTSTIRYAQTLGKVKYDVTGKLTVEAGLGVRQLWLINSTNISASSPVPIDGQTSLNFQTNSTQTLGFRPAWSAGLNYTPTAKTSLLVNVGEQGNDIVPQWNILLNWNPREKTSVTLGVSQSENYSNFIASQYLISRAISGTISQRLFSSLLFQLSGGYTQQKFQNVTGGQTQQQQRANQIPGSFYMVNASLSWKIRDWASLVNTVYYNSGQNIQGGVQGGGNSALSQMWYSIGLNFAL